MYQTGSREADSFAVTQLAMLRSKTGAIWRSMMLLSA